MLEKDLNPNIDAVNFHIGMHARPAVWNLSPAEQERYDMIKHVFVDQYTGIQLNVDGVHPVLRFEDIMAHMFMQCMLSTDEIDRRKIRAARQYSNQCARKICWNCRYYNMDQVLGRDLAQRISKRETHKNCQTCRVAHIIVLGNRFNEFLHEPLMYHQLWQDALANYYSMRRTLKHSKMVTQKVIQAKLKVEKELQEYKKNSLLIHPAMYTAPMPVYPIETSGDATYTEEEYDEMIEEAPDVPTPGEFVTDTKAEKKRFDEALKESMAEHSGAMKGLAEFDEQPIVGRTIEKVVIDEHKKFEKEEETVDDIIERQEKSKHVPVKLKKEEEE